jgi:hypothetical protein
MMVHGQERSMSCLLKEVGVKEDEPPGPLVGADENFTQSSRRIQKRVTVRLSFVGLHPKEGFDLKVPRCNKHETKNRILCLNTRDESASEIDWATDEIARLDRQLLRTLILLTG